MEIGTIGYMPLMQEILTGKYRSINDIPWQRMCSRHFSGRRKGSRHGEDGYEVLLQATLKELNKISADTGFPLIKLALLWSMQESGVTCTVNGVRDTGQLLGNYRATQFTLSREICDALDAATDELKTAMGLYPDIFESRENTRIF